MKDTQLLINALELKMKEKVAIPAWFRNELIKYLNKNKNTIKVIANKIVLNTVFFENFTKYFDITSKEGRKKENPYYKNFRYIKKYNFIHQSSSDFAKAITLKSINPNPIYLLNYIGKNLDLYNQEKDNIIEKINRNDKDQLVYIYIYLRSYCLNTLTQKQLSKINTFNTIKIRDNIAIQYFDEISFLNIKSYSLYRYDKLISNFINTYINKIDTFLFKDINYYEQEFQRYRKEKLSGIRFTKLCSLKDTSFMINNSVLEIGVFSKKINTVKLTINEVDKIAPNTVPMHLLKVEESIFNKKNKYDYEEEDEKDTLKYNEKEEDKISGFQIEELYELMLFLKSKENKVSKKVIDKILKETDLYLKIDQTKHYKICVEYIRYLLELIKERKLRASTVRGYIGILNNHIFKRIENLDNIQSFEVDTIFKRLNSGKYKPNTIKSITQIINRFFKKNSNYKLSCIPSFQSYPKSLIFKDEIDNILETIELNYIKKHKIKRRGELINFDILQNQVIVILTFYSGMRKNEIRSRLLSDIHVFDKSNFMYVNNKGLSKVKLKLKTNSSKRRIKITMNKTHTEIFKSWYNQRLELKKSSEFLFLEKSKNGAFTNKIINENIFEDINSIIKDITKRHCTFHSLRHSFATYSFKKNLMKNEDISAYEMFELCVELGHITPEISLSSYVHAELLSLMIDLDLND